MQRTHKATVVSLMALFLFASVSAFGANTEVKGMILSRTGETLIVKTADGNTTVVLTDYTTTKDDKGLFGLDKQRLSSVVLIPGLKVEVDGTSDEQGRVVAKTITTDGDDLETSEMIQAGLHPTAEQVTANRQTIETNQQNIGANKQQIDDNIKDIEENTKRFTALSEYDVKGEATVQFDTGSTKISAKNQEELKKLAQTATGLTGYIVEV